MHRVWLQTRPGDPVESILVREVTAPTVWVWFRTAWLWLAVVGCCAAMMGVLLGLVL